MVREESKDSVLYVREIVTSMALTMRTTTPFHMMMLMTLMRAVSSTHFHGAHFWFEPADNWTDNRPVVSWITSRIKHAIK